MDTGMAYKKFTMAYFCLEPCSHLFRIMLNRLFIRYLIKTAHDKKRPIKCLLFL